MIQEILEKAAALLQVDVNTATALLGAAAGVLVLGVLGWVFSAIGLAGMAKHRDVRGRWMGWFPILNVVLLGRLADCYLDEVKGIPSDKRHSLLATEIVAVSAACVAGGLWVAKDYVPLDTTLMTAVVLLIAVFAAIMTLVLLVQLYAACYQVYYSCTPDDAKLLTVFTVLLPVLMPFFLFGLRKKANGMPPRRMQKV